MITMFKVTLASISLVLGTAAWSAPQKLQEEKELELVNFKSVKKVLQKDGLSQSVKLKEKKVEAMKKEQSVVEKSRYTYPTQDELWGFISEYWLVKNAQLLHWDFQKPDYGLEKSFATVLEGMGFYQKKFKILLINNPSMVRAGLPGSDGEVILLLSVPFIRSLDLSKLEISLLLLEDFFRLEQGYFKKAVETEKMRTLAGTSFHGAKPDQSIIQEILKKYDQQVNETGFNFQQQFETTKKMDNFLKSNPELWNSYFRMLGKIDRMVKTNHQYKDYVRLYPSPEMQVKWLSPPEKVL